MRGFTLLEIILTMSILAILATAGFGLYYGFQTNIKVDEVASNIATILRHARANSISGEQGAKWGVRFVYPQTGDSYYDVFWGENYASATTTERDFLTTGVIFTNPAASSTLDVIFSRRSGSLANSATTLTVSIKNEAGDIVKNVIIEPNGLIK
jgi:prepilin-type N-terminal cleavage/methylation domain-containing protein